MYNLVNLPKSELDIIIGNTASKKGLSQAIIEKDLWVCIVLDYLFTKSLWKDNLAFKGGTSLSKAYNLIERFSEDIDLILDWRVIGYNTKEPLAERSSNQQDKLNKEILSKTATFLNNEFISQIKSDLARLVNDKLNIYFEDDAVIIAYGNNYSDESILHAIRLEIGALAAWTPTEVKTIHPYIAKVYPEQFGNVSVDIRTTTAERTFWEKTTILHREAFRPESLPVASRMSRHYYDVYRMTKLGILNKAMSQPELLTQVADFKAKFYPQKWARYDLAKIGTLKLVPPDYSLDAIRKDYANMAGMIYGEIPTFNDLMKYIAEIETIING